MFVEHFSFYLHLVQYPFISFFISYSCTQYCMFYMYSILLWCHLYIRYEISQTCKLLDYVCAVEKYVKYRYIDIYSINIYAYIFENSVFWVAHDFLSNTTRAKRCKNFFTWRQIIIFLLFFFFFFFLSFWIFCCLYEILYQMKTVQPSNV